MPTKERNKATVERTKELEDQLAPQGINYLFVVAIDDYEYCPKLYNCLSDATNIIELLTSQYNFDPAYVITLFNSEATEGKIFDGFRDLAKKVSPNDNLIIYFSGHGEYDSVFDEGYWIPVNARMGAHEDFVPNSKIKNILGAINSRHTFLIADSCFSGSLFTQFKSAQLANRLESTPSRWGLTAGRNEVVSDGEQGENSPFADSLLYHLRENKGPIGVSSLCNLVIENVIANAEQTPRGEPLKVKGHRGGQLFFHPKNAIKTKPIPFVGRNEPKPPHQNRGSEKRSKTGSILYQIPEKMALGIDTKCLVRIAFEKEILLQELEIIPESTIKSIRISNLMEVELFDPLATDNFQIRTINETEQIIDREDFTQWLFYIKPLKLGTFPLILKVTVIELVYGKERKKEIVLEESIKVVTELKEPLKLAYKNAGYSIANDGGNQVGKKKDYLEMGTLKRDKINLPSSPPPSPSPIVEPSPSVKKRPKTSLVRSLGGIAAIIVLLLIGKTLFLDLGTDGSPNKPNTTGSPDGSGSSGGINKPTPEPLKPSTNNSRRLDLRKDRNGGKYGFRDFRSKDLVIPHRYDYVANFKEGVAFVKIGNYWALINQKGEEIVGFIMNQPGTFENGIANVGIGNGKFVKINTKGQTKVGGRLISLDKYVIKRREGR